MIICICDTRLWVFAYDQKSVKRQNILFYWWRTSGFKETGAYRTVTSCCSEWFPNYIILSSTAQIYNISCILQPPTPLQCVVSFRCRIDLKVLYHLLHFFFQLVGSNHMGGLYNKASHMHAWQEMHPFLFVHNWKNVADHIISASAQATVCCKNACLQFYSIKQITLACLIVPRPTYMNKTYRERHLDDALWKAVFIIIHLITPPWRQFVQDTSHF